LTHTGYFFPVPEKASLPYGFLAVLEEHGWLMVTDPQPTVPNADIIIGLIGTGGVALQATLVPRIAVTIDARPIPANWDAAIDADAPKDKIAALLEAWAPTPDLENFARVATGFGDAAVRPIAQGLSLQLQAAIADLDAGICARVHHITGFAGTLGFRRVSDTWGALDRGDMTRCADARREARLAVVAIERWLAA
jgi:hypothetical protein